MARVRCARRHHDSNIIPHVYEDGTTPIQPFSHCDWSDAAMLRFDLDSFWTEHGHMDHACSLQHIIMVVHPLVVLFRACVRACVCCTR